MPFLGILTGLWPQMGIQVLSPIPGPNHPRITVSETAADQAYGSHPSHISLPGQLLSKQLLSDVFMKPE